MDMDFSAGWLFATLLVSSVGMGLFLYGKKQARTPQLFAGLVLMIYPGFISSAAAMLAIGAALLGGLVLAVRAGV